MASEGNNSRLAQMQVKYQQRQLQEREKKLEMIITKPMLNHEGGDGSKLSNSFGPGKVRQMFDERRQRGTGIDKSYPLQPIGITQKTSMSSTTTSITKSERTMVNTVRKAVGARQSNGPTNLKSEHSDLATRNRVNENGELLNKLNSDGNYVEVGDYEDSLDDEKFPDTSLNFDDEILNNTITTKLPNVGKLTLTNNSSKEMNNNNVVKLKPVIIRKSSLGEPIKSSLNGNKRVQPVKNHTAPPMIKTNSERSPEKILSSPIAKPRTAVKTPTTKRPNPIGSSPTKSAQEPRKPASTTKTMSASSRPDNTTACKICGRYFNSDRVEKHETICEKSKKKRKVFDVTKHRIEGTDAEHFVKKAIKIGSKVKKEDTSQSQQTKKSDWRRKHEEFISAIRAAKEVQQHLARGGKLSDLPPPPPSENPDYVQCPHCSRRFNETAASRHIPKCATMMHNKPKPVAKKRY